MIIPSIRKFQRQRRHVVILDMPQPPDKKALLGNNLDLKLHEVRLAFNNRDLVAFPYVADYALIDSAIRAGENICVDMAYICLDHSLAA